MSLLTKQEFKAELVNELKNAGLFDLSSDFVEELSVCLFTINELMHYKLTVSELSRSYSFLSGLLSGHYPKIAIAASNNDKIRLAYSMFETMESTQGKLNREEKVMYAFCVFHSVCVEVFDEVTGKIRKGMWEIDSPEHAEGLLQWEMENRPERFTFLSKCSSRNSSAFGITKSNPIMAVTIQDGYNYLNHLRTTDGKPVHYQRLGSIRDESGDILDKYRLSFEVNGNQKELEIYFNPYSKENSTIAPEGLMLSSSEKNGPQTKGDVNKVSSDKQHVQKKGKFSGIKSLWNRFFGKNNSSSGINSVFEKLNSIINNDENQNAICIEAIREKMKLGGAVDKIYGAMGEFGRCIENPIPVNGPLGEITYLSRILTASGEKMYFHRLGSIDMIDVFEMVSQSGSVWDILYVDMYHTRKTRLAPSGYKLQDKTLLIRGILEYIETFPQSFYDILCERTLATIGYPIAELDGKNICSLHRPSEHQKKIALCLTRIQGRTQVNRTAHEDEQDVLDHPVLMDRPVPSKQYLKDRAQAGIHLEHKFSEFEGLCDEHEDFRWIKSELSYPTFDDITFAYRNQIFSVLVKRVDDERNISTHGKKINNLIRECQENNLVPCIFPISPKTESPLHPDTWNLFNAVTGDYVNPIQQSSDKLIEVSNWELNNWAIQIVSDYIKKQKWKRLSFCDVIGIDPQIWVEDDQGDKCWIKVNYAKYPDTAEGYSFSPEKWPSEVLNHKGFIAKVSFCNSETPSGKIYRSKGTFVRFKGIEQIYTPGNNHSKEYGESYH